MNLPSNSCSRRAVFSDMCSSEKSFPGVESSVTVTCAMTRTIPAAYEEASADSMSMLKGFMSAPFKGRVEVLGFSFGSGRAPDAVARSANVLALLLAYALFLAAAALALGAFYIGRPAAALIAIAAGVIARWLVLEGASALDAQALDEIEGQ